MFTLLSLHSPITLQKKCNKMLSSFITSETNGKSNGLKLVGCGGKDLESMVRLLKGNCNGKIRESFQIFISLPKLSDCQDSLLHVGFSPHPRN